MAEAGRIFVSHSHADNAWCRAFVQLLRTHNADVWYDEQNLGFGALRQQIEREMLARRIFVAVFSPHAVASKWVQREIDAAIALQDREPDRVVLPVLAAPCDIPPLLSGFKWLIGPGGTPLTPEEAVELLAAPLGLASLETEPPPASQTPATTADVRSAKDDASSTSTSSVHYQVFSHAITDLYDTDRRVAAVQYPLGLVAALLASGMLALLLTGFLGYYGYNERSALDRVFPSPWLLFLWLIALLVVLQVSILRHPMLRWKRRTTVGVTMLATVLVGLPYYLVATPDVVHLLLRDFTLPHVVSSPWTYSLIDLGIIAVFSAISVRRWLRRARGLPLARPSVDWELGQQKPVKPSEELLLSELVSGDLITGGALAVLLAVLLRPESLNLLFALAGISTIRPVNTCVLSWPVGSCLGGGGVADPLSLSFFDVVLAVALIAAGLLNLNRSALDAALSVTRDATDTPTTYRSKLFMALRGTLQRSVRLSDILLPLRSVVWPLLVFFAVVAAAGCAVSIQEALHRLSDLLTCTNPTCPQSSTAWIQASAPLASGLAWGIVSVLICVLAMAILLFRGRVAVNSLRFLAVLGWHVLLTGWVLAAVLAAINIVVLREGISTRMPFLAPEPLAIASVVCALVAGETYLLRSIHAFYRR